MKPIKALLAGALAGLSLVALFNSLPAKRKSPPGIFSPKSQVSDVNQDGVQDLRDLGNGTVRLYIDSASVQVPEEQRAYLDFKFTGRNSGYLDLDFLSLNSNPHLARELAARFPQFGNYIRQEQEGIRTEFMTRNMFPNQHSPPRTHRVDFEFIERDRIELTFRGSDLHSILYFDSNSRLEKADDYKGRDLSKRTYFPR